MASDEVNGVNMENPIPSCIRFFKQGKSEQFLVAAVEPGGDFPSRIAADTIREWICAQGYGGWLFHEEMISQLSREVRRLERPKEYIVAERKDCQLEIQVSLDRLKAWVRITPACGGESLTEALFRHALEDHHVCFGINDARLQQILQEGGCEKEVIAEGIPPIEG